MNLAIRTDFPKKTESGYCTVYRDGNGWNELVIAHEPRVHAGKLRIQTLDDTTNIRAGRPAVFGVRTAGEDALCGRRTHGSSTVAIRANSKPENK